MRLTSQVFSSNSRTGGVKNLNSINNLDGFLGVQKNVFFYFGKTDSFGPFSRRPRIKPSNCHWTTHRLANGLARSVSCSGGHVRHLLLEGEHEDDQDEPTNYNYRPGDHREDIIRISEVDIAFHLIQSPYRFFDPPMPHLHDSHACTHATQGSPSWG